MNHIASVVSLGVWSGAVAGIGSAIISPKIPFMHAVAIGSGSMVAAYTALHMARLIADQFNQNIFLKNNTDDYYFMRNWLWVSIIPAAAVPYFAGVSTLTAVALVTLSLAGAILKTHIEGNQQHIFANVFAGETIY